MGLLPLHSTSSGPEVDRGFQYHTSSQGHERASQEETLIGRTRPHIKNTYSKTSHFVGSLIALGADHIFFKGL